MNEYLERVHQILTRNNFTAAKGLKPLLAEKDHVRMCAPLTPDCTNGHGIAHGGFLYTLADSTAGVTAYLDGRSYVTADSHMQYISNLREGMIYSDGQVLHRGRTLVTVLVDLTAEDGRLLAHGTFNMYHIDTRYL